MTRAPSAARSLAEAAPSPPAPPTSSTSFPRSDSGNRRLLLLRGDVAAAGYDQEHRQYFAVAEIVIEQSGYHRGENDGNRAMQDEPAVVPAGWQIAQGFP